jgi:hypothetical protein
METKIRGVLDTPLEPVIGLAEGETRWRSMTASCEARLFVNSNRDTQRLKIIRSTSSRCCQR